MTIASLNPNRVLILGAGPVGLGAAVELARFGVPCVLIEKHDGTSWRPKTRNFNTRTMEIARGWGAPVYKRLRSIDAPDGWKSPIRFLESAIGKEFGIIESKGFEGRGTRRFRELQPLSGSLPQMNTDAHRCRPWPLASHLCSSQFICGREPSSLGCGQSPRRAL